jgi:CrcB protein
VTFLQFLVLAVAGGAGAGVRYVVTWTVAARTTRSGFPWGTTIVNLTGSLVLGCLVGLASGDRTPPDVVVTVGAGFLGGYTTFSAASFETVALIREKRYGLAATYGLGVLVAAVALAVLGCAWGRSL